MEVLFKGGFKEDKTPVKPIKKMILETLTKCDQDIEYILKNNIVVGGGNSMPDGFKERLRNEMNADSCVIESEPYRNFNSWVGGSMLASTSVFCDRVCMTKNDESGGKDQNS